VQSHLYSLSFAPNPDWSRHFSQRAEIQSYLQRCVDRSDLKKHLRLDTRVVQARWEASERRWAVIDQHGSIRRCRLLVPAIGGLSRPKWPDIEGLKDFSGLVAHSQQWPEQLDLKDKRVAVIGGGASAIQFVPRIAEQVSQLDLYQRTPQWILPKPDRPIGPLRRAVYRHFPPARLLVRFGLFLLLETRLPAFNRFPWLSAYHRRQARALLIRQVPDPDLRRQLTPDYAMGCKRVLMSNDFYPALMRDNVELVTTAIDRVSESGIIDCRGQHRKVDLILLATGFRATDPIPPGLIIGRDGHDLGRIWHEGPSAYKGTTVHGFPNLFMLLGPNTALGHNSVLLMIESQFNYLIKAFAFMERIDADAIEVSQSAQQDWNREMNRRLEGTVWNQGGCASWYLHTNSGRNTTLWPDFVHRFRRLTRKFDPGAYECHLRSTEN
jgi:cation diffusion facilitator CzcD-associated flavoprotein CzcO